MSTSGTPFGGPGRPLFEDEARSRGDIVQDLHRRAGLPVTIVRPTCVYGPYGLPSPSIPLRELRTRQVCLRERRRRPRQRRLIDDLVDGTLLAAIEPAASRETFNLSGETPLTWRHFYDGVRAPCSASAPDLHDARRGPARCAREVLRRFNMLSFYVRHAPFPHRQGETVARLPSAFDSSGHELTASGRDGRARPGATGALRAIGVFADLNYLPTPWR
jgi:hypothetical protein